MQIIFLDNSLNLTSSSINFKALDSIEKILIKFSIALSQKNHKVTIYNRANHENSYKNVVWKNINKLNNNEADILILFQDIELLKYRVKAKIKFLFLHYKPTEDFDNSLLVKLIKEKICILYTNNYLINALPHNFNYIPKIYFKLGVDEIYKESKILHSQYSNVFVTTHPTKGLDWMLNVWLKYIHPKVPWAELHIYSKLLYQSKTTNNIKIRNLKLTLEVNKNSGIFVKQPLPQKEFVLELTKYKLHLCPSLDNDVQYLSILESQAIGIPVIARETGSLYECIYNNETGYIVKDEESFARKVIQVLSDNRLFITLSNNSKLNNHVISWRDVVSNFERKLNENTFYR